jgi:endonuclease/exonuclease/phosphatase family metal-dependent hydrolase
VTNHQIPKQVITGRPIPMKNSFTVLTANVGNLDLRCKKENYKLCYKDVESRISNNISVLKPDIVTLQEVLPNWQCQSFQTSNKKKVCSDENLFPQIRRLLGEDYTIVCEAKYQYECIGVRKTIGNIIGCEPGSICYSARTIPYLEGCDNAFTVSAITVRLHDGFTFDVVNLHPQSTNANCRSRMISALFDTKVIQEENVLLMGDFNLDPWRDKDESVQSWQKFFVGGWRNKSFKYHSGIVERDPPYLTSFLFYKKRTPDFVGSNFAKGVLSVLGMTPGTARLDGGKGTDHRAIFGTLTY